jgi:hypothetical protein
VIKQSGSLPLLDRGPGFHSPYGCVAKYFILAEFFIYQLMHKRVDLKRILKLTLKQLRHVSV